MKLWKNLSNRLDAVADVMAAKPCMQGCVGKTLLSIPRTPGNLITAVILAIGLLITIGRFGFGLGAVTNLDDNNPWGIWIAFDLLCGVALAAGGYVTSSACYLFGMKRYHSAVRPAILTAFLGYAFVVVALLYDVGQPWRLPYPLLVSQGTTSLLFEVGLCVGIYLTVLFIEWSPVGLEWLLGMKDAPCWLVRLRPRMHTIRKAVLCFTIPLTILGVVLSTMHQSSLGALFLIAPSKMHPLWYSPFMPVFFFISSMVAGLSMVIFEGTLSHKVGFVLLPAFLYALGVREKNITLIRVASVFGVLGIVVNRFNVCLVAFNWQLDSADRYFPSISEVFLSIFIVTLIVTAYRFVCSKMPVLYEHPDFKDAH